MTSLSSTAESSASPKSPARLLQKNAASEKHAYTQILKSSVLIGGSTAVNIVFGIVRVKALAMFVGPTGVGLMGLYSSIVDLAQNVAGMGIQSSGVRQIAEAVGSNEAEKIARTATALKKVSVLLGVIGGVLVALCAMPISFVTFGSHERASGVALLSVAVFLRIVSAGQAALIQGMREVGKLATQSVVSSVVGTAISVPLVYVLRDKGIVPSLVAVAAITLLASWWYSHRLQSHVPSMRLGEIGAESLALLKLGLAFMASGLMMMGSAYLVRIIVLHKVGVEATGLYQSAWALGGLYVGFILQAMGADFYPRLTACATDNDAANRLVNDQTRIGLLLALPGTLATLALAPAVLAVFYSREFAGAVDVLRWICLGIALRVITWPVGFIILAKGRQDLFFGTELAWTLVNVCLTWMCVNRFGVAGAGMAFCGSYMFHALLIYPIGRRLSGFRWSSDNRRGITFSLLMIASAFCVVRFLPVLWGLALGTLAVIATGVHSVRTLASLLSNDRAFGRLQWLLDLVRWRGAR
jgi:antigen flippase